MNSDLNFLSPLELEDRLLWADGVSTVTPENLPAALLKLAGTKKLAVTEISDEIKAYNLFSSEPVSVKSEVDLNKFPPNWVLPDFYKYDLDLDVFLIGLADRIEKDSLYEQRVERLSYEIWLFKELKLDDVLRALIFIVEKMIEKKAVWGVGRGSSCSSYLLFLLGLHEVDPVKYEIDISDFIRLQES